MEDKQVEEIIVRSIWRYEHLNSHRKKQSEVSIEYCPKCNHKVMTEEYYLSCELPFQNKKYYQCLTDGSKFTRSVEGVCELIE